MTVMHMERGQSMERVAFEAHGLIFIWYICILGNNPSQRSCFLHHPVGDLIEIFFLSKI